MPKSLIDPYTAAGGKGYTGLLGGDMASTCVAKPQVHVEVQVPRKTVCKLIVANDDNYALAA